MWIRDATASDLPEVRALFTEYATETGLDLEFQGFSTELDGLPGRYAAPRGAILLGGEGLGERPGEPGCAGEAPGGRVPGGGESGRVLGVVALRPLDGPGLCEMKRLYVRPGGRGTGLARLLADAVLARARDLGYTCMRLDTLESMTPALRLYTALGFRRVPAYYDNPLPDVVYLERAL